MPRTPDPPSGLSPYEIARVCGGPGRVAQVAVVSLWQDGRIEIGFARQRVTAVRHEPRDPVETAVLRAIPPGGQRLWPLLGLVAASPEVAQVGGGLGPAWLRPLRRRRLRRSLAADPGDGLRRVAVLGAPGIEDRRLRRTFQQPDPHLPDSWWPRPRRGGATGNPAPDGRYMKRAADYLEREIERSQRDHDSGGRGFDGGFDGGGGSGGD